MGPHAQAFLFSGLLVVAAGVIARQSWLAHRIPVLWMRPHGSRITHAIRKVDMRARTPEVKSVGVCGPWPTTELELDDEAERCAVCRRAVAALGRST